MFGDSGGGDGRYEAGADSSKPPARHPANGDITVDRHRGFAVFEARAVYFRLPQTCSPIHVDKRSLKTRWTSTPQQMPAPEEIRVATTRITRPADCRICSLIDGSVIAGFVGDDV